MKDVITISTFLLFVAGLVGSLMQWIPGVAAFLMMSPAFAIWAYDMWRARA